MCFTVLPVKTIMWWAADLLTCHSKLFLKGSSSVYFSRNAIPGKYGFSLQRLPPVELAFLKYQGMSGDWKGPC